MRKPATQTTEVSLPDAINDEHGRPDGVKLSQILSLAITGKPLSEAEAAKFASKSPLQADVGWYSSEPIEVPMDDEPAPPYLLLRVDADGNEVDIGERFWSEEEASANLRVDWMYELRRGRNVLWRRPRRSGGEHELAGINPDQYALARTARASPIFVSIAHVKAP